MIVLLYLCDKISISLQVQIQHKNTEIEQINNELQRRGEELQQKDEELRVHIKRVQDLNVCKNLISLWPKIINLE